MTKFRVKNFEIFDVILYAFLILISFCFLYPIWYCLITALTSADALKYEMPLILPADISLKAFEHVLTGKDIPAFYMNSIFYAVVGTGISLALTSMMAYPFIIDEFKGKKVLNVFIVITMFFSGGLIPYYFLINGLGWRNTVWVMLIPGAVSAYNVIIFRTFFKSVPDALLQSAYLDGAGHYRVLAQILIPVSKPLFATFALFGMVGKWNDWFTPYLFITKNIFKPIQLFLQETLVSQSGAAWKYNTAMLEDNNVTELNLKSAIVIITIAPILCAYPFLQKYFVSGIMIGSIKS